MGTRLPPGSRADAMTRLLQHCYGLAVDSEVPLPDLGPATSAGPADLVVRVGPLGAPPQGATTLPMGLWRDTGVIGLHVPDTASYLARHGREIVVDPVPGADPRAVRLFLLGTMMGALLMQREYLVLHGNAFRVGDACAAVVGRSGAGKSTLAAELQRRGLDVLADDVVPIDRDGLAQPGYPRIKLWEDAVTRLGVDPAGLERVAHAVEKYQLPIVRSRSEPLPLRWVYVLERHEDPGLRITPARGAETFALLHEHTYRNELIAGAGAVAEHLAQCARIAAQARVSRVTRPVRTMTAEATADAILSDIAARQDLTQESA